MPRVANIEFTTTKTGKANPTRVADDPAEFESKYLVPAGTKRKSSLLVVDGNGYLRRESVANAWQYRNNTNKDVTRTVRRLAAYFDSNPLPENAHYMNLDINETLAFSATTPDDRDLDFAAFEDRVGDGFNEHGVRENHDDGGDLKSVDVLFEAMEPGPPEARNGVRITEDFLRSVGEKDYEQPPHLKDHEAKNSFARIGHVQDVFFSDETESLWLMTRTPNISGSQVYQEAIARYTHDPPEIRDGSVGFGDQYEAVRNDRGEPELADGRLREFSIVNFPGGYDEGGVKAAFADAATAAVAEFDDPSGESDHGENSAAEDSTFAVDTETITFTN
jgi:hypothetical protein